MNAARVRVDLSFIPKRNGHAGDAERENLTVTARDADAIVLPYAFQEGEVRVTMCGVDRRALLARLRRIVEMAGTEGQRLAACAIAEAPSRGTSMRATGQVSAQLQGLTGEPDVRVCAKARSSRICAIPALAYIHPPWAARNRPVAMRMHAAKAERERAGALPKAWRVPVFMLCSFVTRRPEAKRRATE